MTETKPTMEDGFLIIDREDDGIEPRYLVEHYVAGKVLAAKAFNTNMDVAQALAEWVDEIRPQAAVSSESDAYALMNFMMARLFGWTIVIGISPNGKTDGRTKEAKLANRLLRETYMGMPRPTDFKCRVLAGEEPENLWPEHQREFVRFCLWHQVPRAMNEPLREKEFEEYEGQRRVWPEFLHQYDKSATLADMPEPPPPSDETKALKAARKGS